MQKLILNNFQSPGDVVMLTAAVRDLHLCYPDQFLTDVRTPYPALWDGNPHLIDLSEDDSGVRVIACEYPLIQRSNVAPYHFIHGFSDHLNGQLGLDIRASAFKGDIYLSDAERVAPNPIEKLVGCDVDYWLINAGGKYDLTVKWWEAGRFQEVVDHFRDRIVFVQVGAKHDYHPRLDGVVDLRGKTNLRELLIWMYHAQGVLTPVSLPMHLAAAVPAKPGAPVKRACVVVAGGREPAHWEAYPHHQYIHTCGALYCCAQGGCWKARAFPLGDGHRNDQREWLCANLAGALPRCMDMISAQDVIARMELYYRGGSLRYVSDATRDRMRAARGNNKRAAVRRESAAAAIDASNACALAESFTARIPDYPNTFDGRGIVICGGGTKYFPCAWVCVHVLRMLGCRLPIELWYLGPLEMDARMRALIEPLGVTCIDARRHWKRQRRAAGQLALQPLVLGGFALKPYAIVHSAFREVLLLDADNVPVVDPEFLFEDNEYRRCGAVFWPDYGRLAPSREIWDICGVRYRDEPEFESGQILVDKQRCWAALQLALWYNERSEFFYRFIHGDKDTFHMAFRKLEHEYAMPPYPIHPLDFTMCQHDFHGNRVFQHRNLAKWMLNRPNLRIYDFRHETECLAFLQQLAAKWDGQIVSDDDSLVSSYDIEPLRSLGHKLSRRVYHYHRIGHDSRLISFRANGLVGQGSAANEVYWDLHLDKQTPVLEIASHQRTTCLLRQEPSGAWKGRWLWHERMPIELVPVSV